MNVRLKVDPDRANLSGITNLDIALSSAAADERITGLDLPGSRQTNPHRRSFADGGPCRTI